MSVRPAALPSTPCADRRRALPADAADRARTAADAVAALEREAERLSRLGLESPLARCHQDLRYWSFVRALHTLSAAPRTRLAAAIDRWLRS